MNLTFSFRFAASPRGRQGRSRFSSGFAALASAAALIWTVTPAALAQPGALDSSFDWDGRALISLYPQPNFLALDVAQESSGSLIVGGIIEDSGPTGVSGFVLRLNSSGARDMAFNGGLGYAFIDFSSFTFGPSEDRVEAVAVQPDGKVVIAGSTNAEGSKDMLAMRFHANGTVDWSFNGGLGHLIVPFDTNGPAPDSAYDVALQSDGKIVLAGSATHSQLDTDFAAVRLLPSGDLDPSFGGGGQVTIPVDLGTSGTWTDDAHALAVQSDGKIVLAGESTDSFSSSRMSFVRLLPTGTLDNSFGTYGKRSVSFTSGFDRASGLAIDSSGRLVAGGFAGGGLPAGADFAALRLTAAGGLDSSYGSGSSGKATVNFSLGPYSEDLGIDLELDSGDRALISGLVGRQNGSDFGVVRLTSGGVLDSSFGKQTYDFGWLFSPTDDQP
ncbi:MAG: hypothetical protein AAF725_23500, partial [Acidobacteriota bacterium]